MILVDQGVDIVDKLDSGRILSKLERCGRKCYKSEGGITDESKEKFLSNIIRLGHESVLEHESITVDITTSREISHQLVRHRISSVSQESQRYCRYSSGRFGNNITFVKPVSIKDGTDSYRLWKESCKTAEKEYFKLLENGEKPEDARKVLPNSTKTELMMTMNIRSWRNFLKLRVAKDAQSDIRVLANMILHTFQKELPVLFDDIEPTECEKVLPELGFGDLVQVTKINKLEDSDTKLREGSVGVILGHEHGDNLFKVFFGADLVAGAINYNSDDNTYLMWDYQLKKTDMVE